MNTVTTIILASGTVLGVSAVSFAGITLVVQVILG